MFKKSEFGGDAALNEQLEARERMQTTLQKLQALKSRVSDLRAQCEELQKTNENRGGTVVLCDGCGRAIDSEQDIAVRNFGQEARHYHKECFRRLWL